MAKSWSERIAERYQVRLPDDVADWFDAERWRLPGGGEFNEALPPDRLLDPEPGLIWPGFMLPDTLPIVGNAYGDYLCLRFGDDSEVSECLYWSHAGGDWIPSGRTFAESLVYDALRGRETGGRTPGGNLSATALASQDGWRTHMAWAWAHLRADPRVLDELLVRPASDLRHHLLAQGWARWATARDEVLSCLDCALRARSDYRVAQRIGVPWEPDYVQWMFDTDLIPIDRRRQLVEHFEASDRDLLRQDWETAERLAVEVMQGRPDLGWAFDIAGWAAERAGERERAAARYAAGLRSSLFADHTVAFRTHWVSDGFAKFAAARLYELRGHLPAMVASDPYARLFWEGSAESLRLRVRDYWLAEAGRAAASREWGDAYNAYYQAGWDLGLDQLDGYVEILEGLQRAAAAQGAHARAAIASLQQDMLVDRRLP